MILINNSKELATLCAELASEKIIAVDTEFIREKTYFPVLCLMQVAGEHGAWAIDPLAGGMDLSPFYALMDNPSVLKVFHAARQDIEIFYHAAGRLPEPFFDTQVGAQFLGYGEAVGYGELARRMLGISLDKSMRFTDWSRRPLSPKQIDYALSDVIHLREIYMKMEKILAERGRRESADEETRRELGEVSLYAAHPEDAWKRIRHGQLRPRQLAALGKLAAWREEEAQKRDVPRGRVLKDEALLQLASALPQNEEELQHLRGLQGLSRHAHGPVLNAIAEALASPPESWPKIEKRSASPQTAETAQLLSMLLHLVSARERILPRLIATKDELEALAGGNRDVRACKDWRHELFGRRAEAFLEGRLSLRYDPETRRVVFEE